MSLSLSLFLFFVLFFVSFAYSFETDVQEVLRQRIKKIGPVGSNCETFPTLGPIPPKYAPLMELINSFSGNISQLMKSQGTPSLTVNLVYDQDILWTQGYGLKNLSDPSSTPDGDTTYMIGSNTKLFTTLLGLIAQDKGMISFTDEVATYVPEFAPYNPYPTRKSITFNQLASHMAGLPRECPCQSFASQCDFTNDEMWPRIQNITLVNPPGLIPQYSNLGFATLGHVLEDILDDSWGNLVQNEILGPLGMNNTGTNISDPIFAETKAVGYTDNNTESAVMQLGWEAPAGSIFSSANDMAKFMSFFFRDDVPYMAQPDQILDGLSILEWRQPRYINVDLTGYGLPWEIYDSPIIYTKSGRVGGYLSLTVTVPQLKLGMVLLQSSDVAETYADVFELWLTTFFRPFVQILQAVSPPFVIPNNFSSFTGIYSFNNSTITISVVNEAYPIPVLVSGEISVPLVYFSGNTYKMDITQIQVDCATQQGGLQQWVTFYPTSPPTFAIPGLYYGTTGVMISK